MNPEQRRIQVRAKPVGSREPYTTIGWAEPENIKLELADPNEFSAATTHISRSGSELSFTVFDETYLFTTERLREFYATPLDNPTKKEPSMTRAEQIQSRLRDLEAELADIKRFGDDVYDEGAVITFKGDFGGEKTYAYAAIKAGGRWHLTGGRAIQNATWAQLVDFMIGAKVRKVKLVTETERIVG